MQQKFTNWLTSKKEAFLEILILLVIFVGVFEIHYWNRFYPNLFIGDTEVSGKNYQEVLEKFSQAQDQLVKNGIALVFFRNGASKDVNIPAISYGLTSDAVVEYYGLEEVEKAVQEAFSFGRRGSILRRLGEQLILIFSRQAIQPEYFLQEDAIRSLLDRELVNFYERPVSAQFIFSAGKVIIESEKIGERADNNGDKIIRLISKSLTNLNSETLFFSFRPVLPPVTKGKLEPFLPLVRKIVSAIRAEIIYGDYQWNVTGQRLTDLITVTSDGHLAIDESKFMKFLNKNIKPVIYDPPQNSRFEIQNGKLVEIFKGQSGNSIAADKMKEKLEAVIGRAEEKFMASREISDFKLEKQIVEILLPIVKEKPKITQETINQYRIEELVGSIKTSFKGSTDGRKHNIRTGAAKLNGTLLAPGEEFSAVEGIGLTREEDGFLKEFVIKGNRSVKESGGGLCQIATTLFRLAINAGLPITARSNHLYVVSYYGPGLDATVYGPKKDLRFINDTGHWLLLQARVVGDEVAMELYGQKDDREVTLSEIKISDRIPPPPPKYIASSELKPGEEKCTEQARFGMNAEVTYQVQYSSGKQNQQTFKSIYQPWQKVCLVGSAEQQLIVNN